MRRRIRAIESGNSERTALLAFTANTLREAADECYAAGMDDLLTKPIELKELKAKLELWLPLRGAPEDSGIQAGRAAADSGEALDTGLTGEFCVAHDADMTLLRDALREQRHDTVARAAHRIKGAALMYGDTSLAEAAAQLERIARAGGAWEVTESAARQVDEQTDRLFARAGWQSRRRSA